MAATATDRRETVARLRHFPASPTKVRPVLKLIAGQDIANARDTLRLSDRAIAPHVAKVLDSAVANAEHNDNIPEDELFVSQARADEGPTLKRWRPRARGRGTRIRKRTTHLTIVVARFDEEQLARRRQAEIASGRGPRRPTRRRTPRPVEHDHEHDHDEEHDADTEVGEAEGAPAKKATKKSTATSTKKTTTKKSTAKKAAKTTKKAEKSTKSTKSAKKTTSTTKKTGSAAKKTSDTTKKSETTKKSQDD
jgi:large subunit ribosomal protein L22